MKATLFLSSALALLGGAASAAPQLSAQSIIVNPAPTTLSVKVWTDRDTSGSGTPSYAPGDKIRLFTQVNQDAHVYLFNVDPQGQVDLILPNRFQGGANFLKANAVKVFPAPGDPFTFDIAAPYGVNKVLALASRTPLNLDQIATFKSQQNSFATVNVSGQQGLAQALSIVVNPVPASNWVTDTAFYSVVNRAPVAAPLRTTPSTAPAQPVAAPAPRTAQALSVPANPWSNVREWRTTVDTRDLKGQHDAYAAKLKAEGYTLVKTRSKNSEIKSEFRKGSVKAELTVKRKGNRVEIKIERE
ncbi:DUF4384 domain-containing protein [Deinococcus aquaedulcis]|uniref:DUF4384 domain-containing protein n=1 Tax=Deinococcus aquaedulcis TaxID=2840455 RepID=UPI001C82A144|nr:DUF4384 domain-containing protein [Deinococcus aquaedulcis]